MKKICTCCSALKELEYFYNNKNSKDGLTHNCKSCMDDKRNKWLSKNRSKEAARVKKYREKNPEKAANSVKKAYEKNKDKYNLQKREYRSKNKEAINAWHRDYKKQNKGLVNSINARRRAAKLKATPVWANKFIIDEIYELAQLRTEMLNVQFHVDHIVPLINPMVCGLHVEHNLQIITEHENLIKHNSFGEAA